MRLKTEILTRENEEEQRELRVVCGECNSDFGAFYRRRKDVAFQLKIK